MTSGIVELVREAHEDEAICSLVRVVLVLTLLAFWWLLFSTVNSPDYMKFTAIAVNAFAFCVLAEFKVYSDRNQPMRHRFKYFLAEYTGITFIGLCAATLSFRNLEMLLTGILIYLIVAPLGFGFIWTFPCRRAIT